MEELTAGEVRARSFAAAVRGFDRGEVTGYLDQVADYLEALQQQLHQVGVSEVTSPTDLAAEYAAVGDEVTAVLAEARAAADAMRSRAAAETARWRAEAEDETRQMYADAEAAASETRESVWVTGTEMLAQVVAECELMVAQSSELSLRIRSEAERDSAKVLTDSQREREAMLYAGRDEAERTVGAARKEADALMMSARHQTDVAHERVRALEQRRAELMEELESTQKALLGIEDETMAAVEEGLEEPEPVADMEARTDWPEDEGGVRIVAARPSVPVEPVDADALVAEVEALRGRQPQGTAGPAPPKVEPVSPPLGGSPAIAPSDSGFAAATSEGSEIGRGSARLVGTISDPSSPQGEETGGEGGSFADEPRSEPSRDVAPPLTAEETVDEAQPEPEAAVETEVELTSEPEPEAEAAAPEPEETAEAEPEPEIKEGPDPLAGLFDELRGGVPAPLTPATGNGEASEEAVIRAAPVATLVDDDEPTESTLDSRLSTLDSLDPFALRDRLLLPVQNRALRLVKRELVSSQNRALEDLRLNPEWLPGPDLVDGEISVALLDLTTESTAAGFAAAGELLGRTDPPRPELEAGDPTEEFIGAFIESARLSLERSRAAAAGKRETASSLSRVFRAWRTDDAERRVRFLSRRAYHDGVLAALMAMDCQRVLVSPSGTSCVDHGEGTPPWLISDGPPPGSLVPPASIECSCTIVPDC